jgi:hypothetical protein
LKVLKVLLESIESIGDFAKIKNNKNLLGGQEPLVHHLDP